MIKVIRNYGLDEIIESLRYLLDQSAHSEKMRMIATEICQYTQDKMAAIYDFVSREVDYVSDPVGADNEEIELFISPIRMVEEYNKGNRPAGDCDDHALLVTSLFRSLGIHSNIELVDCIGEGLDHALSVTWSDKLGKWLDIDTTVETPLGWVYPYYDRVTV